MRRVTILASALVSMLAGPTRAEPIDVTVLNNSRPTLCAEEDNVEILLKGRGLRSFRVEARQPSYVGAIVVDNIAPDFVNCRFDGTEPEKHRFEKRQFVFFEDDDIVLVGNTFETHWRPERVPVTVGTRTEAPMHLLQLYKKVPGGRRQVLVLYPIDGGWRARPLPPPHLKEVGYGTTFMVGPIEFVQTFPVADIRHVVFDAPTRTFTLDFVRGGRATVRLGRVDTERTEVHVTVEGLPLEAYPFGSLRSMYVTEDNADSSRLQWREAKGNRWFEKPVMEFGRVDAHEFRLGRSVISRHNTSAPDTVMSDFSSTLPPAK